MFTSKVMKTDSQALRHATELESKNMKNNKYRTRRRNELRRDCHVLQKKGRDSR